MVLSDVPELRGNFLEWIFSMMAVSFTWNDDLKTFCEKKPHSNSICGKMRPSAFSLRRL